MATTLILLALAAYGLAKLMKIQNRHITNDQRNGEYKMIPADLVILTTSINIGSLLNPTSAFRLITDESLRIPCAFILVFLSLIVYCLLISVGSAIHNRNQDVAFCVGADKKKQIGTFLAGAFFIIITILIAAI